MKLTKSRIRDPFCKIIPGEEASSKYDRRFYSEVPYLIRRAVQDKLRSIRNETIFNSKST